MTFQFVSFMLEQKWRKNMISIFCQDKYTHSQPDWRNKCPHFSFAYDFANPSRQSCAGAYMVERGMSFAVYCTLFIINTAKVGAK